MLSHATMGSQMQAALHDSQILTPCSLPFFRIPIRLPEEQSEYKCWMATSRILVLISLSVAACIVFKALTWKPGLVAFKASNKSTMASKVLILAHGRSGSSYLGQIFNNHPDVFYMYEPLITLQVTTIHDSKLYEQSAKRLLDDIFNCQFMQQTEFLAFMSHMPLNRFSSHVLTTPYCKSTRRAKDNRTFFQCEDLDPLITSLSCTLHKHVVVKVLTHRLAPFLEEDYLTTLLNSNGNLKIIHLLRDPRAVIASLDRVGWVFNRSVVKSAWTNFSLFSAYVQKFCTQMIQSLSFALSAEEKFHERYKILRYEDLIKTPMTVSQELFDFFGIRMTAEVKDYVTRSSRTNNRRNTHAYSTIRNNVSSLIDSWRKQLSIEAVRTVESNCRPVLDILRYTPVYSQNLP